jgi:type IV secretory pathway TrbF-like protein
MKNSPVTAFEKARIKWFEQYGSAVVGSNRMFFLAMSMVVAVVALCITIMMMMPLKTVQPYLVKVNADGMPTATPVAMESYRPGEAEKKYFLSDWAVKLLTLDRFLTNKNLLDAYARARDKAIPEFAEYVETNKPAEALRLDPNLTRIAKIRSVAFISDGAALVRAALETRSGKGQAITRKNVILTIHYSLIPPRTEQEIFDNPIGLYITHFALSEDLN